MKFRHIRGSYEASMNTTVEVNSLEELATHLDRKPEEIKIEPYSGIDHRNGWNTHTVMVPCQSYPGRWVIGFTDGVFA